MTGEWHFLILEQKHMHQGSFQTLPWVSLYLASHRILSCKPLNARKMSSPVLEPLPWQIIEPGEVAVGVTNL